MTLQSTRQKTEIYVCFEKSIHFFRIYIRKNVNFEFFVKTHLAQVGPCGVGGAEIASSSDAQGLGFKPRPV